MNSSNQWHPSNSSQWLWVPCSQSRYCISRLCTRNGNRTHFFGHLCTCISDCVSAPSVSTWWPLRIWSPGNTSWFSGIICSTNCRFLGTLCKSDASFSSTKFVLQPLPPLETDRVESPREWRPEVETQESKVRLGKRRKSFVKPY